MTKFLTAAAWSALVIGGAAVAEPPATETAETVAGDVTTEATSEVKTIRYGDAAEVETEAETSATIAAVTIEGEEATEEESEEADADELAETDAE